MEIEKQDTRDDYSCNPFSNDCTTPLILTWNQESENYKINKPLDQSGEYVSKKVADELLEACVWARKVIQQLANEGAYPKSLMAENGGNGVMPLRNAIITAVGDEKAEEILNNPF